MGETKKDIVTRSDLQEEAAAYCDRSSIIGANYFFSHYTLIEKVFWVIAVIVMLIAASVEVNLAFLIWDNNPTVTTTASIDSSIAGIQFPTVTICPDFTPDKNGFVRNMLNLLKYQCDQRQGICTENKLETTAIISSGMNTILGSPSESYLSDLIVNYNSETKQNLPEQTNLFDYLLEVMRSKPMVEPEYNFLRQIYSSDFILHDVWLGYYGGLDTASVPISIPTALEELYTLRLKGILTNFQLFESIEAAKIEYEHESTSFFLNPAYYYYADASSNIPEEAITLFKAFERGARITYMVLAWPLPGQFGTLHFNFQTFRSSPDRWFCDASSNGDNQLAKYYIDILTGMLRGVELGVSPSEISAILYPVPAYFDMEKYPMQFPYTVWNLKHKYNKSDSIECPIAKNPFPELYSVQNYFGKLLGPHLMHVMEIMYNCQLRIQPLDNGRYLRLADIYGQMEEMEAYLKSQLIFMQDTFNPAWTDYLGNKTNLPYFWAAMTDTEGIIYPQLKLFENVQNVPSSDKENQQTLESLQAKYQYLQMLTLCKGPGRNATCEDKIQPVITDNGICFAFNALSFNSTMINNTYTDIFQEIYEPNYSMQYLINNTQNGKAFQLYMVLDSHQSKILDNISGKFRIGINQAFDFMNIRDAAIDVEVGYLTKITIVPVQYLTTDAFKTQDIKTRQCRYLNENPDESSLFRFYSYSGCIFECRLRFSAKTCGCTPWNYPQYGNDSITEICDGPQSYCFEETMDTKNKAECDCHPDCESVSYRVTSDIRIINYYQECYVPNNLPWGMTRQDINLNIVIGEKIRNMEGEEFLFWYNLLQQNQSALPDIVVNNKFVRYLDPRLTQEKCMQLLKSDFAILTIEISVPTMTTLKRDMAVDFFTKISNVGGTLGLFTGMGILSFVEIGFLLYRIMRIMLKLLGNIKKND